MMSFPRQDRSRLSDDRLIELCQHGDEHAFEMIVKRYRPPLLCHCRGIAPEEAEDAVQQAFIDAWRALRGGADVRHLQAWLFTIARRAALQGVRRRGELSSELPESLAGNDSPTEKFEQARITRDILAAITRLPDAEHDALVSMSVHGRSARATARELGVSEGAVRQLVFRARAQVRAVARAFVPPIPALRLLGRSGHARLRAALGNAAPSVSASPGVWTVTKFAGIALLGAGVAAPVAALSGGQAEHFSQPSNLARAIEPGVAPPSARSGAPRTSRSHPRLKLSARRLAASKTSPANTAVTDGTIASGLPALASTPAAARGGGASAAGTGNGSVGSIGQRASKLGPDPGTVVEATHSITLAPPMASPPISSTAPSAGHVAAEAEGAIKGTAIAVGGVVQEAAPVQPRALPSLP